MAEDRDEAPRRPATERADELLSRAGQTAGIFASLVGMRVARVAAFAREEVEDMWAEARSIHQQAAEAEGNGDVRTQASEGTDVSRREAEEQEAESEQDAESDGEAKVGATAAGGSPKTKEPDLQEAGDTEASDRVSVDATDAISEKAEDPGTDPREDEGTRVDSQSTTGKTKQEKES